VLANPTFSSLSMNPLMEELISSVLRLSFTSKTSQNRFRKGRYRSNATPISSKHLQEWHRFQHNLYSFFFLFFLSLTKKKKKKKKDVVAPVCCPSRSAIWSGRHIHKIPHMQENPVTGLKVGGSWNNHEGLPLNYTNKISDILERNGYNVGIFGISSFLSLFISHLFISKGKTDWSAGGHSLDCR